MNRIHIIGTFGYTHDQLDGQTVKTREVYSLMQERYSGKVTKTDTLDIPHKPWLFLSMLYDLALCHSLILLPAGRNLTHLFPFLYYLSKILRYDIVCICIGGWQIEYFNGSYDGKSHLLQERLCKKIKAFLPELKSINNMLIEDFHFTNTEVFPNFREAGIITPPSNDNQETRLVFMARIQKKKGYPAIFHSAEYIRQNKINATITFYGQITPEDKDDFLSLVSAHQDIVSYQGPLAPKEIHNTLAQYDAMLLPTTYYTEGFPGSILDAYIAGIPVIVTEWKHAHEFVTDGESGFIIPFTNGQDNLNMRIKELYLNKDKLMQMKKKAKAESSKYTKDRAWEILSRHINRKHESTIK